MTLEHIRKLKEIESLHDVKLHNTAGAEAHCQLQVLVKVQKDLKEEEEV